MSTEGMISFSVTSVVDDVLQQHGTRFCDTDLASRKAEEAAQRRYDAAEWLRKTVGLVGAKDLPAEPSEDEFRLGLRSGIILCNVLNKVQPGAVPKVIESPSDAVNVPDGAALSAYQYFENLRNFLTGVGVMGLPTFDASDLEQGGKSSRIVNCVLALKSYSDSKQFGGSRVWKSGGSFKSAITGKYVVRKNSELFTNSLTRNQSNCPGTNSQDGLSTEPSSYGDLANALTEMKSTQSVSVLVREVLSGKNPEEVPALVESLLSKVMEEFERRLACQNELMITTVNDLTKTDGNETFLKTDSDEVKMKTTVDDLTKVDGNEALLKTASDEVKVDTDDEIEKLSSLVKVETDDENEKFSSLVKVHTDDENVVTVNNIKSLDEEKSYRQEELKKQKLKQQTLLGQQQSAIQELRQTLSTTKAGMHFMQMKCLEEYNVLGRHMQTLAIASSGYHRVLEENRKLYNQVQDLKGSIRVYCRVRPFLTGQPNRLSSVERIEEGSITIVTPSKYGKEGRKTFAFNKVFGPTASQEEVFSDTQPLIRSVLDGFNVCIFAYGQTGSGKTHTMTGPRELTEKTRGVNYRALNDLFLLSEQRKNSCCYDVSVQMIEIYNEQVRDLLATDGGSNKRLEIRNSSQNGLNVPDANLVPVKSPSDVLELMNLGHRNRAVSSTALNDRSSRSHSCLTVHVQGREVTSGSVLRGCMHLVDLAGSERVDKSEVIGDRLKEAQHINRSLAALGDVISSLAQKNSHVPYRNSKLTQLLQDSLGGQAKTLMFVHISPEPDATGETISTLKFAERVSTVELGAARANKNTTDVKELKEKIATLKAALARKEGEPEYLQNSKPSSPEQVFKLSESPVFKPSGSPLHQNRQTGGDTPGAHSNGRQPMEDVGNKEVRNNSLTRPRKTKSLEVQELLTNSPPWAPVSGTEKNFRKEDEKETGSGDWVDKVVVNKQEVLYGDEKTLGHWDGENGQLPELFYQSFPLDPKIYPERLNNRVTGNKQDSQDYDLQGNRSDMTSSADSDELEVATSDSSEPDMVLNMNHSKTTRIPIPNGIGSKIKKPQSRAYKSSEIRSSIPTLAGPSPASRIPNGVGSTAHRSGRQPASADMKRRAGNGK